MILDRLLAADRIPSGGSRPSCHVGQQFDSWLQGEVAAEDSTLVFVGLNAPFDWSFVNYYFHHYLSRNPFGFTALDIKAEAGRKRRPPKQSAVAIPCRAPVLALQTPPAHPSARPCAIAGGPPSQARWDFA